MGHFDPFLFISTYIIYKIYCRFYRQKSLFQTQKGKKDTGLTKTDLTMNENRTKVVLLLFCFTLFLCHTIFAGCGSPCCSLHIAFAHFVL